MSFTFEFNDLKWYAVIVGLFCSALGIGILLISFMLKCSVFSKNNKTSKWMVGFAALGSIFFGLTCIFSGLSIVYFIGVFDNYGLFGHLCNFIQILCWHSGQIMVYCYLLERLYKGFEGTIYGLTLKTLIPLCGLMGIYFIACLMIMGLMIWYIIWSSYTNDMNLNDLPDDNIIRIILKSTTLSVDLILSVLLLRIFVHKLYHVSESLTIMMNGNEYDLMSIDTSSAGTMMALDRQTLEHQKENIYTVVSKVVLLGVIMIITSQLVLLLSLINWIINTNSNDNITVVYVWFKALHTFIASLSLFLGFEFANNWYKFCCGFCHKRIKSYCINRLSNKIKENIQFE